MVVEEFLKLVSINSDSTHEKNIAEYLFQRLNGLGCTCKFDDSMEKTGSDVGNLLAFFPGNTPGAPTLLLCAHMDTITSTEGMVPVIKDGVIYSDGAHILGGDDKAGLAIIITALENLHNNHELEHGDIEILFTVQEERGLVGAKNFDMSLLHSKYAYVLDNSTRIGTLVFRSPTRITLNISVEGKAAHAGLEPEHGINAIVVAAHAISKLRFGRIDEETTSNIGVVHGGKAKNIVANHVEMVVEIRSRSDEKLQREFDNLVSCFQKTADEWGAEFKYARTYDYIGFNIDPHALLITNAEKAAEELGIEWELVETGAGLDANIFNAQGLPSIAMGIGVSHFHSETECAPIEQLCKGAEYMTKIISTFAEKSPQKHNY